LALFHAVQAAIRRLCFCSIDSPVSMKSPAHSMIISDIFMVVNRLPVGKESMLRILVDAVLGWRYPLSHCFARPEMGNALGLDNHIVFRGWVATGMRWVVVQAEATEASDLDALAMGQRLGHLVEKSADRKRYIAVTQVALMEQRGDQLGLCHGWTPNG
jgi:hypothetical protein